MSAFCSSLIPLILCILIFVSSTIISIPSLVSSATNVAQSSSPFDDALAHYNSGREYQYFDRCQKERLNQIQCNLHMMDNYEKARSIVKTQIASAKSPTQFFLQFDYEGMLNDLAVSSLNNGDFQGAKEVLLEVLSINENHVNSIANLAHIESMTGDVESSNIYYEKAISLDPNSAILLYNYATFLFSYGKYVRRDDYSTAMVEMWLKSSALLETFHNAFLNLAVYSCGKNDLSSSSRYYDQALDRTKHLKDTGVYWSVMLQKIASAVPMIPRSKAELLSSRREYIMKLSEFSKDAIFDSYKQDVFEFVGCGALGYYFAYHGLEDILPRQLYAYSIYRISRSQLYYIAPFLQSQSELLNLDNKKKANTDAEIASKIRTILDYHYVFPKENYPIPFISTDFSRNPSKVIGSNGKIKVGFLSAFFLHHSVGLLLRGIIKGLNRDIFDVFVFLVGKNGVDIDISTSEEYRTQKNIQFYDIRGPFQSSRALIASMELDVLVFGELGMDHTTYFMSFSRLARRSLLFWGHALTSGISERMFEFMHHNDSDYDDDVYFKGSDYGGIDYFISSTLFEADIDTCQFEYVERLLLHTGVVTSFEWPSPPLHFDEVRSALRNESNAASPSSHPVDIINSDSIYHKSIKFPSQRISKYNLKDNSSPIDESGVVTWKLPSKAEFLCHIDPKLCYIFGNRNEPFVLVSIPQTLYKFHVDIDDILIQILSQTTNENLYIAFIKGSNETYQLVKSRIESSWLCSFDTPKSPIDMASASACDRILWLPFMSERSFLTLVAVSDFVLDSFPLGGGRSSLEILSSATPIVSIFPRKASNGLKPEEEPSYNRADLSGSIKSEIMKRPLGARDGGDNISNIAYEDSMNLGVSPTIPQFTYGMYKSMKLQFLIAIDSLGRPISIKDYNGNVFNLEHFDPIRNNSNTFAEINCCVVRSVAEYVQLAILLVKSPETRRIIGNAIQDAIIGPDSVFDDKRVVHEWEYTLLHVLEQPRPVPNHYLSGKKIQSMICANDSSLESNVKINEVDLIYYRALCEVVKSDFRWNIDEFNKTIFSYTHPLVLESTLGSKSYKTIQTDHSPLIDGENNNANLVHRLNNIYTDLKQYVGDNRDLVSDHDFIFSYVNSKEKDGDSSSSTQMVVSVSRDSDWLISCLNSSEEHRMKVMLACLMIGFEFEKSKFKLITNVNLDFVQGSFSYNIPIYRLSDMQLIFRGGLKEIHDLSLVDKAETCAIYDNIVNAVSNESPPEVRFHDIGDFQFFLSRRIVGRKMMCKIMSFHGITDRSNFKHNNINKDVSGYQDLHLGLYPGRKDKIVESFDRVDYDNCIGLINADIDYLSSRLAVPSNSYDLKQSNRITTSTDEINHPLNTPSRFESIHMSTGVAIGITTSRRLNYFFETADSLLAGIGSDVPNAFIQQIIVVDEFSSHEDRVDMMKRYPQFTFIFKSNHVSEKGHASSLNILLKHVKTRYFIYLEDDWKLMTAIHSIDSFFISSIKPIIDKVSDNVKTHQYYNNDYNNNNKNKNNKGSTIETSGCLSIPQFIPYIIASLGLLGFEGDLSLPLYRDTSYRNCIDNSSKSFEQINEVNEDRTSSKVFEYFNISISRPLNSQINSQIEDLHLILFNDQTSRDSAEVRFNLEDNNDDSTRGYKSIPSNLEGNKGIFGSGGWTRAKRFILSSKSGLARDYNTEGNVSIPIDGQFSLHEFGAIPVDICSQALDRTHDFAYWPSLSLNPGIWDLSEVKRRLSTLLGVTDGALFDENDVTFEHRFTASSYTAGLNMAYFPALVFKHIGKDSAYLKNGIKREWEA